MPAECRNCRKPPHSAHTQWVAKSTTAIHLTPLG
jgi:hypothetical protein